MEQTKLEMKIALLRDERARNGWAIAEAQKHSLLMDKLKTKYPKSKYV